MRHGNVLHLIKIFLLVALMKLHLQPLPCCVNICSLWYPRKPSNCVALAVFKPERQSTFSVGSVSLSRWVLIYSYSTHTLRWWEYQARIYKTISRLNKTAKNAKNGKNVKERTLNSCNRILLHYPHGFHYPHAVHINGFHYPHGSLMRIFLHCLFAYLWITFPNISNISSFEQRSGPLDPITKTVESYHQDLLRLGRCQA